MILTQSKVQKLVFLLVNTEAVGVEGASPTCQISVDGQTFVDVADTPVEVGGGWYSVNLSEQETATEGPLIFVAQAPTAAYEWRDIFRVQASHAVDSATIEAAVRAEMERWSAALAIPIDFIRAGSSQ